MIKDGAWEEWRIGKSRSVRAAERTVCSSMRHLQLVDASEAGASEQAMSKAPTISAIPTATALHTAPLPVSHNALLYRSGPSNANQDDTVSLIDDDSDMDDDELIVEDDDERGSHQCEMIESAGGIPEDDRMDQYHSEFQHIDEGRGFQPSSARSGYHSQNKVRHDEQDEGDLQKDDFEDEDDLPVTQDEPDTSFWSQNTSDGPSTPNYSLQCRHSTLPTQNTVPSDSRSQLLLPTDNDLPDYPGAMQPVSDLWRLELAQDDASVKVLYTNPKDDIDLGFHDKYAGKVTGIAPELFIDHSECVTGR